LSFRVFVDNWLLLGICLEFGDGSSKDAANRLKIHKAESLIKTFSL